MNAPTDRAVWLAQRMAGLGGSDMGAIFGLSPYRTPVDVWMEKTGRSDPQDSTLQMRFGNYAEEFVAREYCAKTNNAVQRYTPMLHHATAPIIGNVDRLVVPPGQKRAAHQREIRTDRLLECKTASAFAASNADEWGAAGTDQVPMSYLVQCATYRMLTGCRFADLAVLFGNQELRIYHLPHDADLEQMIVARASEWWQKHVVSDIAPDPVCDADVKALYPESSVRAMVEASDSILHELTVLREAKREIGIQESIADSAMIAIKNAIGITEGIAWNGETLATWKSARPSAKTDWRAVAADLEAQVGREQFNAAVQSHTATIAGSRRFLLKDSI